MKKNNMLRLASVLLVAVLLSTCAISGAFAKYMVSGSVANQTATVANFGVTATVTPATASTTKGNAFLADYAIQDTVSDNSITLAVDAADLRVAPGTEGEFATLTITDSATREVAVKVEATANLDIGDKWIVGVENYFPVVIKVNDVAVSYEVDDDAATIETAVEEAIMKALVGDETGVKEYAAGTLINGGTSNPVVVTWDWLYTSAANDDEKDTALGQAADKATISLTFGVTVTQID